MPSISSDKDEVEAESDYEYSMGDDSVGEDDATAGDDEYSYCEDDDEDEGDGIAQASTTSKKQKVAKEEEDPNVEAAEMRETFKPTKRTDYDNNDNLLVFEGACFSIKAGQVTKQKLAGSLLHTFLSFCQTSNFVSFVAAWGLSSPVFEINQFTKDANPVYDRFLKACKQVPEISTLQIVFHGTREENISNILQHGLDPRKRSGQAYGPGEYFAKQPSISVSYCHGGKVMLVFAVVVPDKQDTSDRSSAYYNCPPDYVVVPTVEHQYPLGVVHFSSVNKTTLAKSQQMKNQLGALAQEVKRKIQEAEIGCIRAEIIQNIIQENIHIAQEVYSKNQAILHESDKQEISNFVHLSHDPDIVAFYFPNLPPPRSGDSPIKNVNALELEASSARQEFQLCRQNLIP